MSALQHGPKQKRLNQDGGIRPRSQPANSPRADMARRLWAARLLKVPGALQRAGNAAISQWLSTVRPGRPLDPGTRATMEATFGADFRHVRVHDDPRAAATVDALGATAVTHDTDIHLGPHAPPLESQEGKRLLAHELAHVVQQHRAGEQRAGTVNHFADAFEADADRAAKAVAAGRPAQVSATGAPPSTQRQVSGQASSVQAPSTTVLQQSQGELVLESFLNRMWGAQSKQEKPFRVTPKVLEGLNLVFPFGAPIGPLSIFPSTKDLMNRLHGRIPPTIDLNVIAVLDRLPEREKPLSSAPTVSGEPAKPQFPTPGPAPLKSIPDPRKPPERGKGEEEAMQKALEAAFEQFRRTKLGQELEKSVRSYVFSKAGIPLVILVAGGVLTFVAANDPKLPSTPEIPLGEGIKLKIEYQGRVSDLPPLLRDMVKGQSEPTPPPGKSEVKAGVSVTFTFEAMAELAKAVGNFFAKAATWIARGVVKVGTVIGRAVSSIKTELLAMAGGAALGALIGGLAGGGLGAGIGALIGVGAGLLGSLLHRLITREKRT